jgi:hypothetical protein
VKFLEKQPARPDGLDVPFGAARRYVCRVSRQCAVVSPIMLELEDRRVMTRRHRSAIGVLAACLLGMAAPGFGQDVTLRYRWTAGEDVLTRMTQQTRTMVSAGGPGMENAAMALSMTQVFRTTVEQVAADGSATLRQVIESIRVEMETPLGKSSFDSTSTIPVDAGDQSGRMLFAAFNAMLGQPITMVVSPQGAVVKIDGMGRLLERILNAQPADRLAPDMLAGLRNTFSDDRMRDMLGWGAVPFPARALRPGDTWDDSHDLTIPVFGVVSSTRTWTLRKVEDESGVPVATLTATVTSATSQNAQSAPPLIPIRMGKMTGATELAFDVAHGRLLRLSTEASQPITMSPLPSNRAPADLEMVVKTTMSLDVLDRR